MQENTNTKISDGLRLYIEALVEEAVLKGKAIEDQKQYLHRF